MTSIVDEPEELDARWLTDVLRHAGRLGAGEEVLDADVAPFGTGQLGRVVRARLRHTAGEDVPTSLVVKLPSADPGSRQAAAAFGAYEAEVRFYRDLAGDAGVRTPDVLWGDVEPDTGRFTLVLEDLADAWRAGDSVDGAGVREAAAALREAARLHAAFWDAPDVADRAWLAAPARTQLLFDMVAPYLPTFLERFGDALDADVVDLVRGLAPHAADYPRRAWTAPLTVVHADYRLDNLVFRDAPDGRREATVLDWQNVRVGPALVDVAIYLGSCLTVDERRARQDELLDGYRSDLAAGGVELAADACLARLREASLFALLLAVPVSVNLRRDERGDRMFLELVRRGAALAADLDAGTVLDR
ncbi:MAG: phosphotransferase [Solirubrobacteraceae bacterium]|nr:phosphotransferase [Solirubrobacteraceae bacterium]